MTTDTEVHPCFSAEARHHYGRIHLPVAASCNVQCRYCDRKYDCVNESRPGVSSVVLSPSQALIYLRRAMARDSRLKVVGIAGPGDPLANPAETLETLHLVRDEYPDVLLCVATNGLMLPSYGAELAELKVSHVTVTVNAVEPTVGARIYAWVREAKRPLRQEEGAALLLERQLEGIRCLKELGVTVKVNTIIVPGINDEHIPEVARTMGGLGVDIMNCVPLYPVAGSDFADRATPSATMVNEIRRVAGAFVPQMSHCARCRADASGLIGEGNSDEIFELLINARRMDEEQGEGRPYVAVGSQEGVLVNQHLGEATRLLIFGRGEDGFHLVETRRTPSRGGGKERWESLAALLHDCRSVLVSGAGDSPRGVLVQHGIRVLEIEGLIESALRVEFGGGDVQALFRKAKLRCGRGCGSGGGCA